MVHFIWDMLYKTGNEASLNYETLMPGGHLGPWEKEKKTTPKKGFEKEEKMGCCNISILRYWTRTQVKNLSK